MPIRVPEFDTEVLVGLDQLGTNEQSSGFFPNRLEIVGDDTSAVHWLAVLGEGKGDVWVAAAVLGSTAILLAQSNSAVDTDPQHTKSFGVLLNGISLQNGPHVKRHGLGCNVHAGCGLDGVVDEVADQRKVEQVGRLLGHGYAPSRDLRDTHQCEGQVLQERCFWCHVHPQTDSADQ